MRYISNPILLFTLVIITTFNISKSNANTVKIKASLATKSISLIEQQKPMTFAPQKIASNQDAYIKIIGDENAALSISLNHNKAFNSLYKIKHNAGPAPQFDSQGQLTLNISAHIKSNHTHTPLYGIIINHQ